MQRSTCLSFTRMNDEKALFDRLVASIRSRASLRLRAFSLARALISSSPVLVMTLPSGCRSPSRPITRGLHWSEAARALAPELLSIFPQFHVPQRGCCQSRTGVPDCHPSRPRKPNRNGDLHGACGRREGEEIIDCCRDFEGALIPVTHDAVDPFRIDDAGPHDTAYFILKRADFGVSGREDRCGKSRLSAR